MAQKLGVFGVHPDGNGGVSLQIFMNEDCKDTVPWASRQTSCQRTGIITGMKHRNIGQVKPVVGGRLRTALTLGAVQADSWAQAWVTAIRVQPGRVIPARSCPNQRNQPLFFFFQIHLRVCYRTLISTRSRPANSISPLHHCFPFLLVVATTWPS